MDKYYYCPPHLSDIASLSSIDLTITPVCFISRVGDEAIFLVYEDE